MTFPDNEPSIRKTYEKTALVEYNEREDAESHLIHKVSTSSFNSQTFSHHSVKSVFSHEETKMIQVLDSSMPLETASVTFSSEATEEGQTNSTPGTLWIN
jgi:hypothetical protein